MLPNSYAVSLGKIGDLDGDGCYDFGYGRYGPNFEGNIVVISGRTGAEIRTSVGLSPWGNLGHQVVGAGDMDGDGVPDYAGSNMNGNLLMVFSGATGASLYTWTGAGNGTQLIGGKDVDLDGVPDLIAGHPGPVGGNSANPWGPIRVHSGRDGSTVWEFYGDVQPGNTEFSRTMAWLGPLPGSQYPGVRRAGIQQRHRLRSHWHRPRQPTGSLPPPRHRMLVDGHGSYERVALEQ